MTRIRFKPLKTYINKFSIKFIMPILFLTVVLIVITILPGCASNSNNKKQSRQNKQTNEVKMDGVKMKLTANAKTEPDSVALSLNIENINKNPIKLTYTSAKKYDFIVKNGDGVEVWHWSQDKMFTQQLSEETLPAGKSLKFSTKWTKINDDGEAVKPGKYIIYGKWQAQGFNKIVKASVDI